MRGDEVIHSTQPQVHCLLLMGPFHQDIAMVQVTVLKLQSLDSLDRVQ